MIYIYGLFDPRNLELRYIGMTENSISIRLSGHISEARHSSKRNHKVNWIRQLLSEGLVPAIEVLEECTIETWQESEQAWIADCKKFNVRLVNVAKGGNKPPAFNELPKAQMEEVREKWSKTRKGRPSPNVGREWSQDYKDKMSRALSGKNNAMYGLKGKNHPAFGYRHNDEIRKKISDGLIGKKLGVSPSDETRRKIGLASKGRKQSEADKAKKSLSERMHHATKKGLTEKVLDLQDEQFTKFGYYHPKYPHR